MVEDLNMIYDEFRSANSGTISHFEAELTKIIAAWRSGDTDTMAALAMAFTDTPEGKLFYDALLVQRNKNWLPQLEQMLATPEVELVLVGALHLAGEANVLQLLREQGYSHVRYVDGGMSDNARPALYAADYSVALASRLSSSDPVLVRVAGKHCESGDIVVRDTTALGANVAKIKTHTTFGYATQLVILDAAGRVVATIPLNSVGTLDILVPPARPRPIPYEELRSCFVRRLRILDAWPRP